MLNVIINILSGVINVIYGMKQLIKYRYTGKVPVFVRHSSIYASTSFFSAAEAMFLKPFIKRSNRQSFALLA